jgi:type I restriction enzyme S subunit
VASFDGICSSDILVLAPRSKVLHPDFLLYVVQSDGFFAHALQTSSGSLSPRTRWQDLATFEFELPSIEEQHRIVEVMTAVDEHIESLRHQLDVLQTTRKSVLHHLLNAGGKGWTETTVSNLLSRSIGGVWGTEPGTDQEEVTVVRSTEFTKSGALNFATGVPRSIKSSQLSSRVLTEGDILLEKSGGGPLQPVGRVVYVQSDIPPRFVCSNFIQLLTPDRQKVLPRFLFLVMWMWHSENKTLEYQKQTTGIRNLRTPDYLEQVISLPPLDEQQCIVDEVSKIDTLIRETNSALAATQQLRSALLNKEIS